MGYPLDVIVIASERDFEETKGIIGGIAYPAHRYGRVLYEAADEIRRDLVRQWMGKAEQDLAAAEILLNNTTRLPSVIAARATGSRKMPEGDSPKASDLLPELMIWERFSLSLRSANPRQPKGSGNQRC